VDFLQDCANAVKLHFDSKLTLYDKCSPKIVPRNDELQKAVAAAVPGGAKFLDLGLGTGDTSLLVLKKFPDAKITGVDFSKHMLASARNNLQLNGASSSVEIVEADFTAREFGTGFDAAYSAVAIHNNSHEKKEQLFKKVFGCLKKGGTFVNGDFVAFEDGELDKKSRENYEAFVRGNLSGAEAEHWVRHAREEDLPASLEKQFSWLKQAGFKTMDVVWQFENVAVYVAKK